MEFSGYAFDLLMALQNDTGISYNIRLLDEESIGFKHTLSGLWSGIIGEVVSKKADLSLIPLLITSERSEAVDFTTSFYKVSEFTDAACSMKVSGSANTKKFLASCFLSYKYF